MGIDVVFAQRLEQVALPDGRVARVRTGQHWPASDPVVQLRPELFTTDPRFGLQHTPGSPPPGYDDQLNELDDDVFESASAAPGERRSVRRRT